MLCERTVWLAYNEASGSNSEDAHAELDAAFGDATCTVARKIGFPDESVPTADELDEAGIDLLAVFAGDGTINSVVTSLYGWQGAILVLPGGTMNLLSRRLHGNAGPCDIVRRVADGKGTRKRPTVVRSRLGDGLTGVLAGPGTAWNDVREAMRATDLAGMIEHAAEAIGESTAGAMVECRDPIIGRRKGYPLIMMSPTGEGLDIEGYYAESIGDFAKQGFALLRRNFREGPHERLGLLPGVTVASPDGNGMGLLIDGEPADSASEERFELARCGVDLVATVDDA